MDVRIIKPLPGPGVFTVPPNAVVYTQDGTTMIDFIESASERAEERLLEEHADAVCITCMRSASQPVEYVKEPPKGFRYAHHFAGWENPKTRAELAAARARELE